MAISTDRISAAAYIRVSTDDQIEFSPDSQIKKAKEYAQKNNMILLDKHIFIDEGISGKNAKKRPAFNQMVAQAKSKSKPFDIILVWKFSRFARNQEESIVYKSMLKKQYGVNVISISEPMVDGPFGNLIERIIEWSDEYYSINLAQEVKRGMTEKASRGGVVAAPPFGYKVEDNKFIADENAETVKGIFDDFLSGMGSRAIAMKYTDMGVRTRGGNPLDNRFIEYVLFNPVYCGKIRWCTNGKAASKRDFYNKDFIVTDGDHEPIVDEKTFQMAQELLKSIKARYGKYQRREQYSNFMLKGLVKCDNCGATLCMSSAKTPALQCHKYSKGQCSVSHSVQLNLLNDAVIDALRYAASSCDFNIELSSTARNETTDFKKLIDKEKLKLSRAKIAYSEGIDTLEEYAAAKEEITATLAELENKRRETVAKKVDNTKYAKKVQNVVDLITDDGVSESAKNECLRTILTHIVYVKAERTVNLFFYE